MTASPVIAVVGPPSAGVSSLIGVLAARLPDHVIVEDVDGDAPDAVIFVASAAAPLVDSDVVLLERAAARTDVMVAAVSKIDAHRRWRDVLSADRALLAHRHGRYRRLRWTGVAAAPDLGEPRVDELVEVLRSALANVESAVRNRLRAGVFEPAPVPPQERGPSRRSDALAVRVGIQRSRVTLVYLVRGRCAEIGADLRAGAAELPRAAASRWQVRVSDAVADVVAEVQAAIDRAVDDVAGSLALPPPGPSTPAPAPRLPRPRPSSHRLETRLTVVLGGGFGLGVALTLSRLMSQLEPGLDVVGLIVGSLAGLVLCVWIVGIRSVLHDRELNQRWVGEVVSTLRNHGEEMVATRLLEAEIALSALVSHRT